MKALFNSEKTAENGIQAQAAPPVGGMGDIFCKAIGGGKMSCDWSITLTKKGLREDTMKWYKEKKTPLEFDGVIQNDSGDFSIRTLSTDSQPDITKLEKELVLQWILAPFLIKKDVQYHFIGETKDYAIGNVASFFETAKGVYINGELIEIRVSDLKNDIFTILQNKASDFNPVVKDIYMRDEISLSRGALDVKDYEIIMPAFREMNTEKDSEVDGALWDFLVENSSNDDQSIIIFPYNWLFSDELHESLALNYFSNFSTGIILTVNTNTQHVRAIELVK